MKQLMILIIATLLTVSFMVTCIDEKQKSRVNRQWTVYFYDHSKQKEMVYITESEPYAYHSGVASWTGKPVWVIEHGGKKIYLPMKWTRIEETEK